jgi:hypothetical protein
MRKRVLQLSSTIKLLSLLIKRKHILAVVSGNRAEYVASNFPGVAAAVSGFGNQPHALEARWREIVTEYSQTWLYRTGIYRNSAYFGLAQLNLKKFAAYIGIFLY